MMVLIELDIWGSEIFKNFTNIIKYLGCIFAKLLTNYKKIKNLIVILLIKMEKIWSLNKDVKC